MRKVLRVLGIILGIAAALLLAAFFYYIVVTGGEKLDPEKLVSSAYNLQIYDKNDVLTEEVSARSERRNTHIGELSEDTKNAFLSIEDKRFYTHDGLSYRRMAVALWHNIKARSFREGASTISQQLIKNTHLSGEKTINRKLKELKLTKALEKNYSKDEILEIYLNTVYFGHNAFGITDAADYYFGKHPSELSIGESALLAGLLRSPNNYSPFRNREKCEDRRNLVLQELYRDGKISGSEYHDALNEPLPEQKHTTNHSYTELVFDCLETEAERLHITEFNGLKIYTYLDSELQKELEGIETGDYDSSFIVADNRTHAIVAYRSDVGEINRQPGSVLKPLLVYAPALEEKYLTPATLILDEPVNFNGYAPHNYNNVFHGYVSAKEALAKSINIPAIKILNGIGVETGLNYLKKMELNTQSEASLTLALGGTTEGYSLSSLTAAYSVFANEGIYSPLTAIRAIETPDGKLHCPERTKTKVFSESTVTLTNDMLRYTVESGTAKKLKSLPYPIYAKTGTAGNKEGNTDAYTLSYTQEHTVGVWLGHADYTRFEHTGGGEACKLCKEIYEYLYKSNTPSAIPQSKDVTVCELDKLSYTSEHILRFADENAPVNEKLSALFAKDNLPTQKSTYFTHPTVQKPEISYQNGKISIQLCQTKYYQYRVERLGKDGIAVIYDGDYQDIISDIVPEDGQKYVYRVTPYYKNHFGETITLPTVTTKQSVPEPTEQNHDPIKDKKWWEE